MNELLIETHKHSDLIDITQRVEDYIPQDLKDGICVVYVPHTTAGVTINEGTDPSVQGDILNQLERLVPWIQSSFRHLEGNSAAHIKASLVGQSATILIKEGKLQLGTWQKIFFCEFDGSRRRKIWVQYIRCL